MAKEGHPPAFMIPVGDVLADGVIDAMPADVFGAFMRLLLRSWTQSPVASLPDDDPTLAAWSRLSAAKWRSLKARVLAPFAIGDDGRWHCAWLSQQHQSILDARRKRSRLGIAAASVRWGQSDADALPRNDADACFDPQEKHADALPLASKNQVEGENCASSSSFLNTEKTPSPPPSKELTTKGRKGLRNMEEEGEDLLTEEEDWQGVARLVRKQGLVQSGDAIAAARSAGCKPCEVAMLLAHFEAFPKAWGAGLLHHRIKTLRPGDDPAKGWPDPSPEWRDAQDAKAQPKALGPSLEEQRAKQAAEIASAAAEIEALTPRDFDVLVNDIPACRERVCKLRMQKKNPREDALVLDFVRRALKEKAAT
jgi:uncharacterized protein YdaU (DUF1376 family)